MFARELPGAQAQLERLRTCWRQSDGMLATVYRGSTCIDPTPLVADLGDTAPFLATLGFPEQALQLARAASGHLTRGLFRRGERAYLFDNHDLVLGWLELHEQTGEDWLIESSRHALAAVQRECEVQGRLVDWGDPGGRSWRASAYNAGFVEVAVDLFHATRDTSYLECARRWARSLIHTRSFRKHGLWSRFDTPRFELLGAALGRLSRYGPVRMFKDNTNCVWGLLALFLEDQDGEIGAALERFVAVVTRLFERHGHIPEFPGRDQQFDLSANIFVAELLADIARFKALDAAFDLACRIVESVERRRWKNGLLPRDARYCGDHLDMMVDFGVALCKLDALGAGRRFYQRAEQGWQAVWRLHQSPHGLVQSVDSEGRVLDDRIIVKYQFLATKALLVGEHTNVYDDTRLWRLLRDR